MSFDERSIEWMPALDPRSKFSPSSSEGRVVPAFLLSPKFGFVEYPPGSTPMFNISEPRDVSMYNDILLNGSRSFAVFARDPKDESHLAAVGVSLYLTNLKVVLRQPNAARYQCRHNVTGRVRLHGVLNPADVTSEEAYVNAEVSDFVDVDDDVNTTALEVAAVSALKEVAELQEANEERVRFPESLEKLHAGRGIESGSLWSMVILWTEFLDMRARDAARKIRTQGVPDAILQDPRELVKAWLGGEVTVDPGANVAMSRPVKLMLRRLSEEVDPLLEDKAQGMQLMLQTDRHADRLQIFIELIERESTRQNFRATLKAAFGSGQGP